MTKTAPKRFLSIIISIIILFSAFAVFTPQSINVDAAKKDSKKVLINKIKKKTDIPIVKTYYADYNGNGTKELFAICGERGLKTDSFKEVWFSSTKQTKSLFDHSWHIGAKRVKVSGKQSLFIAEIHSGGSTSSSKWYYVKSDKVKGNSKKFSGLKKVKGKDFRITEHAFDLSTGEISLGHTCKQYYIKWNGSGFTEYKGTVISKSKLKSYSGGASVINKIISLGYRIGKIFKRDNGIVNINLHKSDGEGNVENQNVNLRFKNNKVSVITNNKGGMDIVEKSSYGGVYKSGIVSKSKNLKLSKRAKVIKALTENRWKLSKYYINGKKEKEFFSITAGHFIIKFKKNKKFTYDEWYFGASGKYKVSKKGQVTLVIKRKFDTRGNYNIKNKKIKLKISEKRNRISFTIKFGKTKYKYVCVS